MNSFCVSIYKIKGRMRKNQYVDYHKNQKISDAEIERKWRLYEEEQANFRMLMEARAQGVQAIASAGAAGGGRKSLFYAFSTADGNSGFLNSADSFGNLTQIGTQFNGLSVFCKNQENGLMYYIEQDTNEGEMVVGVIDPSTGSRTELSRSVLTDYYYPPASLSYLGGNNFLYLDNSPIFGGFGVDPQSVLILNISNEGIVTISGGAPITTWNSEESGLILTSLFSYNEEIWAFCTPTGFPLSLIGKLDTSAGEINDLNPLNLESLPFTEAYKIFFIAGCTQSADGSVYVNAIINDKSVEVLHQSILKLDPEDFYNSQYVQEINEGFGIGIDIEII